MSVAAAVAPGDDIYDNGTQRVSSSSCSIPKSRKCSFSDKAYRERDRCPARDAICYSCINPKYYRFFFVTLMISSGLPDPVFKN